MPNDSQPHGEPNPGRLPAANNAQAPDPGSADGPYYDGSDLRTVNEEADAPSYNSISPLEEVTEQGVDAPAPKPSDS